MSLADELPPDHQLHLAYQPKVDLRSSHVVGYEGLVRWHHPERGVILPKAFLPAVEAQGAMDRLTERVVALGLGQAQLWGADGVTSLALNLSGPILHDPGFTDRLIADCAAHGVAANRLILELNESTAMAYPLSGMDVLTRIRLKGLRLSIDDFGTGYSSLALLARLPFSELKVDKSFVTLARQSPEARAIVKSVIDLAHNLGLQAVAEGVETPETLHLMVELGCDLAQGFCIAQPLAAHDIAPWHEAWVGGRGRAGVIDAARAAKSARRRQSAVTPYYDGSDDTRIALAQALGERINPLWELGRNSLIGWRPGEHGLEVLMVPYQQIVDRFAESQRLLHGKRLMGEATFRHAMEVAGTRPVHIDLPFHIADHEPGAVPTDVIEQVLRRYGITETQHRAVALFDIVGFARREPRIQVAQLNSLECSINSAHRLLHELGRPVDLARTSVGDGFYIWNRDKGPQADLDTYLLTLLVLADNAVAWRNGRPEMVPEIRTCFSIGPHYSYYQVDGLDPRGHDYIVGEVTIGLARMISECLPGQILIGDFARPADHAGDPVNPLDFVARAGDAFARFADVRLHGRSITGVRCYLTGDARPDGAFDVTRFRIADKHGFEHHVFNQKFNLYLATETEKPEALFLGRQHANLEEFAGAKRALVAPAAAA